MKKYILAAVTLAAFTGMSFAQTPTPAAAPAAAPAKVEKPVAKKHEMKKGAEVTMGEITAVDAAKNMITVKDNKGVEKQFTLESVANLAQGAKVKVSVKDGKTTVKEMKDHKGKHEGKKHDMKKADAPKAEAAPAAAGK
jgi:hypothetical protein